MKAEELLERKREKRGETRRLGEGVKVSKVQKQTHTECPNKTHYFVH